VRRNTDLSIKGPEWRGGTRREERRGLSGSVHVYDDKISLKTCDMQRAIEFPRRRKKINKEENNNNKKKKNEIIIFLRCPCTVISCGNNGSI